MKRVIGCGNLLMQDEGIGVHLIEYLKGKTIPQGVELVDGGCSGFDLLGFIQESREVVIVDAVKAGGKPGDIYKFSPDDYRTDTFPKTSLHDVSLKDIFEIVKKTGNLPRITIFGVEPKTIDWGMELTPEVGEVLPRLAELVIKEIHHA
ncbi:MAG: HyaD/HybD family hydrogenase maturation endopeptidase [Candidatus Omnitrophica bacterium]|jgi:hydrogenase maturation protease|nr:HyaD/HybD family hydrogenase maturation endopeptidase [Candidatus Omnitrophota bacterium]MDD5079644.1 HyaD/HybD family hydrogenase maturation endopeptidase [Candidatus Omnitrophota bacterium]